MWDLAVAEPEKRGNGVGAEEKIGWRGGMSLEEVPNSRWMQPYGGTWKRYPWTAPPGQGMQRALAIPDPWNHPAHTVVEVTSNVCGAAGASVMASLRYLRYLGSAVVRLL